MRRMHWLMISAVFAIAVTGCGKTVGTSGSSTAPSKDKEEATQNTSASAGGPAEAAHEFLEALRTGNDEKASQMLSTIAREKTASLSRNVTPPASDTARFSVGEVDYVNDDGARVSCTWTDIDADGEARTDNAIWVLRREEQGWRIVGVAAQVFPDEEPLLLNFEDPEDMFRKQQWVREEIRRRMEADSLQAQGKEKADDSLRR